MMEANDPNNIDELQTIENTYTFNLTSLDTKSTEPGFLGTDPSLWFSEEALKTLSIAPMHHNPSNSQDKQEKQDPYFDSYSHYYIHEEMLKDTVRTNSYQRAILQNHKFFANKVVLDVGCGTGILAIFAVRAGAKHVYGVEFAEVALYAREIVERAGYGEKITVVKGKVEELC